MSNSLSHVFLFEIITVKESSMEIRDTGRVTFSLNVTDTVFKN